MWTLVETLMVSTMKHVCTRIHNETNCIAYLRGFTDAATTCKQYGDDIDTMIVKVNEMHDSAPSRLIRRYELFADTNKYYIMGLAHALDVVNCLGARFKNGYRSDDEVFVRNLLAHSGYKVKGSYQD